MAQRQLAWVINDRGCWIVSSHKPEKHGYVRIRRGRKATLAHRMMFEKMNGPIPPGMIIMHICDTPACVNPAHLRLGTQAENVKDRDQKGRLVAKGHPGIRNPWARLDDDKIRIIRRDAQRGIAQRVLAVRFGVNQGQISKIVTGRAWRHIRAMAVQRVREIVGESMLVQ